MHSLYQLELSFNEYTKKQADVKEKRNNINEIRF